MIKRMEADKDQGLLGSRGLKQTRIRGCCDQGYGRRQESGAAVIKVMEADKDQGLL